MIQFIRDARPLPWSFDPLQALQRWPANRQVSLLHSGRLHNKWARWSILASPIGTYRYTYSPEHLTQNPSHPSPTTTGHSHWLGPDTACPIPHSGFSHNPFHDLRQLLNIDQGIWIGYLSYELARWVEPLAFQPQPRHLASDQSAADPALSWPIIDLGYCPGFLVHDNLTKKWFAYGAWHDGQYPDLESADLITGSYTATNLRSSMTHQTYLTAVAKAKQYIAAGDIFQANIAQRFSADFTSPLPSLPSPHTHATRTLYNHLTTVSPPWYGAYLELAHDDSPVNIGKIEPPPPKAILSTSPELFLDVDRGHVTTRPIKGTSPASTSTQQLRNSDKDIAELAMIVDLLRNDLGRVCNYGSVKVAQPRTIETHPTVHHGVATITAQLHSSKDIVDLLRATIPGGSVTGVPKVRAIQIIDELEPVPRGPYCGCIGFLSPNRLSLNIAIRTLVADPAHSRIDFSVGGGIVADSDPNLEYQETLHKAAAAFHALGEHPQTPPTIVVTKTSNPPDLTPLASTQPH